MMTTAPEIVLGVTGSIAAYKAGDLVRALRDEGYTVSCIMTQRATRFIAPTTLQALSERKVHTDLFDPEDPQILHTAIAEHAKLILVVPATANIIGKFANGLADDLLSCILLAAKAKILIAPAMNVHMWQHPIVQRNVTMLKRLGVRFIGPEVGKLVCGYEAIGHLAAPEEIVRVVKQWTPPNPSHPLVTSAAAQRPKRSQAASKSSRSSSGKRKARR